MSDLEMARKRQKEEMDRRREKAKERVKAARDTQFRGYAEKLLEELEEIYGRVHPEHREGIIQHNARRAYDLVTHVIAYVDTKDLDMLEEHECVHRIPDMTALPKEAQ